MPTQDPAKPAAKKAAATPPAPERTKSQKQWDVMDDHDLRIIETGTIAERLAGIARDLGAVDKGQRNADQKYNFRGIDDLMNALHPLLAKYSVTIAPRYTRLDRFERPTRSGGVMSYVVLQGDYTFTCPGGPTDWTSLTVTTIGEASDTSDKATNKAMSAALKYALIQTFTVPTKDMDDADRVTVESAPMPTREALIERIDKCCAKMGMPREDITQKYRERHGGISQEAFENLAPEVLLPFVVSLEGHVEQQLQQGGK
ncbi:MAG: ERF family protein [Candidatus Nanopelagicales bacterium]|jgi:hypothetical protein|nr:ERF family protein [Candidatus Nanopelagicales bacterium]